MCAAVGHAMVNRLDVIYVDTLAMDIPVCVWEKVKIHSISIIKLFVSRNYIKMKKKIMGKTEEKQK